MKLVSGHCCRKAQFLKAMLAAAKKWEDPTFYFHLPNLAQTLLNEETKFASKKWLHRSLGNILLGQILC
jgi:hypothetical protein